MKDVQNEIRAVTKLCGFGRHDNILPVLRCGKLSASFYFLDMPLCHLNLEGWINGTRIPRHEKSSFMGEIWKIMRDVTNGLSFIHSENEVHRDLKPRNSIYPCFSTLI